MPYLHLEQDLLRALLAYDRDTGKFRRVSMPVKNQIKLGAIAGHKSSRGYIHIKINGASYKAHRLAWIYTHGSIPEGYTIDHENGVKDDNRLFNLRLAKGQADQNQNTSMNKNNTSGYKGVVWGEKEGKWKAQISSGGKKYHLGCFNTKEEANAVREYAKKIYHTFNPVQRI